MKDIFAALLDQMNRGCDALLLTMIEHAGSVPRGMGSQMVIGSSGIIAGTIGGGIGEREMTAYGLKLLDEKRCGVHTYALHGQTGERLGSVCGGAMTVYFQYVSAGDAPYKLLLEALLDRIEQRQGGWLIQSLDGGMPALLGKDGVLLMGERPREAAVLCRPFSVRTEKHFAMPLYVGERAVLFGAGHCAQALAPLLASVGFRVTVYDNRPELANKVLFPQAECIICAPFEEIEKHLTLDGEDYVIAMSSTHASDLCVMRQILQEDRAYVGMLGSRPKRAFIFGKLLEGGVSQEQIDSVHTPIGMNIKAVTSAEIAISIAGEMVLVRAESREKSHQ
ncbi:MAG: XdhC family protein [Clostridia bacterium]|nr:XdhC family protein [Clostridia bacterium]